MIGKEKGMHSMISNKKMKATEKLTMSKTRFGSRSKCPINDCK